MTQLIDWSKLNDLPDETRMRWPCTCVVCGFNNIWVVWSERCIVQTDGTFKFDGDPVESGFMPLQNKSDDPVRDYGYPVFWKRGREEDVPEDPPFMKPNWSKDVAKAKHFLNHEDAEKAAVEAVLLHPTAIGKLRVIQFRIR